jgi:hypothetical protein
VKPQQQTGENSQPAFTEDGTGELRIERSTGRIPSSELGEVDGEPDKTAPRVTLTSPISWEELSGHNEEIPEPEVPVFVDSIPPELESAVVESGVPKKPWQGFSVEPGKKAVIGIIVVIIIIAVILGVFFIYPLISGSQGINTYGDDSRTALPTIVKNSGAAIPTKPLIPSVKTTRPVVPGNRPANVGF